MWFPLEWRERLTWWTLPLACSLQDLTRFTWVRGKDPLPYKNLFPPCVLPHPWRVLGVKDRGFALALPTPVFPPTPTGPPCPLWCSPHCVRRAVMARTFLAPFDCSGAEGFTTMDADPFIRCDYTGTHRRLAAVGAASIVVYGVGIPLTFGLIILRNRAAIVADQAMRIEGTGDSILTNPNIYIRRRYRKLYEDFQPQFVFWKVQWGVSGCGVSAVRGSREDWLAVPAGFSCRGLFPASVVGAAGAYGPKAGVGVHLGAAGRKPAHSGA